jgi:non-heme chloroperoxidase
MSPTLKSIRLPSGVKLEYAEQGAGDGTPVILLHGITDSWRSYEPVLPHLPSSLRAFALSQRGHGGSSRPKQSYAPRDFAADVAAFIEALGLGPAIVVGHSMGSCVAQSFAIDYPRQVQGLVLVGSFCRLADNPAVAEFWQEVEKLGDPVSPAFVRDFQESTLTLPVHSAFLDAIVAESLKVPARVWRDALQGLMSFDRSAELRKVKAPTLILWGDCDGFARRVDQDDLSAALPRAQLSIYEGVGHALHWEDQRRFSAELCGFVKSIAPRQRSAA